MATTLHNPQSTFHTYTSPFPSVVVLLKVSFMRCTEQEEVNLIHSSENFRVGITAMRNEVVIRTTRDVKEIPKSTSVCAPSDPCSETDRGIRNHSLVVQIPTSLSKC